MTNKYMYFIANWKMFGGLNTLNSLHNVEKFLKRYKLKYNKIASAMITNLKLLEEVSREKKMTLISTGMASIQDIKRGINVFKKN